VGVTESKETWQRELDDLRAVTGRLEQRLARVEAAIGLLPTEDEAPATGPDVSKSQKGTTIFFGRLALISFVLVGALVLRTVTRQGWLTPGLGAWIGLVYCGLLMFVPLLLERYRSPQMSARMLQICGGLLAPLIILETAVRAKAMSIATAAVVMGFVGLCAGLIGVLQKESTKRAALILLAQVLSLAALGLTPDGAPWRGGALLALSALAIWLSHRGDAAYLRPVILLPVWIALAGGVLLTARRSGIDPGVSLALILCVLGIWILVLGNSILRRGVLDRFERVAFVLATLWAYGLSLFYLPGVAMPAAPVLALILLVAALSIPVDRMRGGAMWSSALLPSLSLPWMDPSGLTLGVFSLLQQRIGLAVASGSGRILSHLMVVIAVTVALSMGGLLSAPDATLLSRILMGGGLGLAALIHYWTCVRREEDERIERGMAPLSLVSAVLVTFCTLRLVSSHLLGHDQAYKLSLSLLLGGLSLAALLVGRWSGLRATSSLGLIGIILLAAKVLVWDLAELEGVYLVISVLNLGFAALITSLILKSGSDSDQRER
jgi:hypothetical protein